MMPRIKEQQDFWAFKGETADNTKQLVLLNNVQFIYELALAQLKFEF
jgi:hypothetical protein